MVVPKDLGPTVLTLFLMKGGLISPPICIIEMTSWSNDAESLTITSFFYFGLMIISQLVLSVFIQY